ncbi:MAG: hypothetical protein IKA76_01030 [Clostridia bacterium]|nr:hypothetical protein [Clostridia bacterium]
MISCTEFIPSYSELFSYLDENLGGHAEVERFWAYLFEPTGKGIPLINFAKKDGQRGCWDYWMGTLHEEAADCTKIMNEKAGWIYDEMLYCPSKGRLLELEKELGIKPYYDYCGHCDYYRASLEQVGLTWFRNHIGVDEAKCSSILYDPKVFKGMMVVDENTVRVDIRSKENEYFHRDFHSSLNMGIDYMGRVHGMEHLKAYLVRYTKNVYKKTVEAGKTDPLGAIEARIRETYTLEKATDALTLTNDGKTLTVAIAYCPAVKHLRATGRELSPFFRYSTEYVMATLAEEIGVDFSMDAYDEETGKASYHFTLR